MPLVAATVWTVRRKWLGNLVPALFWIPPAAFGIFWMAKTGQVIGIGLWCLIGATVIGWITLNLFGLFENAKMRRQLELILEAKGEAINDSVFVGISTPTYSSMLDPHEDVGFLRILHDRLSYIGENRVIDLYRDQVKAVRFRPNVHTLLGLGRWVSVEGELDGKPLRLLVEPREKRTLLGNLRYSSVLRSRIKRWMTQGT